MVSIGAISDDEKLYEVPYRKVLRTEFVRSVKWIPTGENAVDAFKKNDSTQVSEKWIIETILTAQQPLSIDTYGSSYRGTGYDAILETHITDPDMNTAMVHRLKCAWNFGVANLVKLHIHWIEEVEKSF